MSVSKGMRKKTYKVLNYCAFGLVEGSSTVEDIQQNPILIQKSSVYVSDEQSRALFDGVSQNIMHSRVLKWVYV